MSEGQDVDRFVDMMRSHHFLQTITNVTRPGHDLSASSLIDHIWINQLYGYSSGTIQSGITDHYSTFIQIPFSMQKSNQYSLKLTFRDCSEYYQQIFEDHLKNVNWDDLKNEDVNVYAQNLTSEINHIYENSFPLKTKFVTRKYFLNPWYTKDVKNISDARTKYHNLFLLGLVTRSEYAIYRNKITSLIRKCKELYYQNCFSRNFGNIKASWKIIRNICNGFRSHSIDKI